MQSDKNINVYDFDGTLYNGDSSKDFFLFMLFKNPHIVLLLPKILFVGILYLLKIVKIEKFKSTFFSFLKMIDNPKSYIDEFWKKYEIKINSNLKFNIISDKKAVIVSAGPRFLIEPIALKLNVKNIICSNVDIKTGKWLDENCSGENKTKYLDLKYKNYSINNSYSNSYSDRFVARKSKNAFLVENNKIISYDERIIYYKKIGTRIGLIFFFIYFFIGLILNYNNKLFINNNLLFQSDTKRVFNDYTNIFIEHDRIGVHPLILFVQPFIFFINSVTHDYVLSIVFFQSIIGALCIKYLFQTLYILNNNKISILLSMIYGFTFSSIIFNTIIELYSLSCFIFILFWFNIIKDIKYKNNVFLPKYILIGILSFGCIITNISVFIVGILLLYLYKKINLKYLFICILATIGLTIYINCIQESIWYKTENMFLTLESTVNNENDKYTSFDININKVENVYEEIYVNGIIANDLVVVDIDEENIEESKMITFSNSSNFNYIIVSVFLFVLLLLIIRNIKNDLLINIGLIICLLGMTLLHIFYGNNYSFLYSQNIIYLIILLYGNNYRKNNIFINIQLFLIGLLELIFNIKAYLKLLYFVSKYTELNSFLGKNGYIKEIFIFLIIDIILVISFYIIKYFLEYKKEKILLVCFILLFLLSCMFIKFNAYSYYCNYLKNNQNLDFER